MTGPLDNNWTQRYEQEDIERIRVLPYGGPGWYPKSQTVVTFKRKKNNRFGLEATFNSHWSNPNRKGQY